MANGFFSIEQWRDREWVTVGTVDGDRSLSDAIRDVESRGQPGLFRVVQIQRMIWAEEIDGKLQLRKWHANSPETLARTAEAFDRDGGKWPEDQRQ